MARQAVARVVQGGESRSRGTKGKNTCWGLRYFRLKRIPVSYVPEDVVWVIVEGRKGKLA